jgi:peptidoglycan/LPS O-acetylase OafA/YrhL
MVAHGAADRKGTQVKIRRNWVTPLAAGAFLLSAVTGVLIFFHLDTGANRFVHEWLGWALLAGVALHAYTNFGGFKSHLASRRGQMLIGGFAMALLVSFLPIGDESGEPPFVQPIRSLSRAPLTTLAQVAQVTPEELRARLGKVGIQPASDQQSLSDLIGSDTKKQMHVLKTVLASAS